MGGPSGLGRCMYSQAKTKMCVLKATNDSLNNYCSRDVMEKSFPEFYDYYLSVINDNSHLNGHNMQVGNQNILFYYLSILLICENKKF